MAAVGRKIQHSTGDQNLKHIPRGPFCPSSGAPRTMKAPIEIAYATTHASKGTSREANCQSKFKVVRENEESEKQFQIMRQLKSLDPIHTKPDTSDSLGITIYLDYVQRTK